MKFSKAIVGAVVVLNVVFTVAVLWLFLRTGSEPTALVAAWFAFTTGELWALAAIKRKEADKSEDSRDKSEIWRAEGTE